MKISPYFSAIGHMAQLLDQEGAAGLVLFNRFYQPDIDLAMLTLTPTYLSTPTRSGFRCSGSACSRDG